MKNSVKKIYDELFVNYPRLSVCSESIASAFMIMADTYRNGGKILVCGNGGSAADSEHIVGELMKGFMLKRKLTAEQKAAFENVGAGDVADGLQGALPAISLVSHTALATAFLNDCDPRLVFAQQVFGYMNKADTLIALSTSGNSANVVKAAQTAAALGGKSVSITGESGGKLGTLCDSAIKLPSKITPEIQELTLPVYHALCAMLEAEFFED